MCIFICLSPHLCQPISYWQKLLSSSRQSNLTVMLSDTWVLWFLWLKQKICKTSPKALLSGQSISAFLEHSSQTECVRAGGEWIILDYLSSTWEAYYKTATAEINLLEFPGNLEAVLWRNRNPICKVLTCERYLKSEEAWTWKFCEGAP